MPRALRAGRVDDKFGQSPKITDVQAKMTRAVIRVQPPGIETVFDSWVCVYEWSVKGQEGCRSEPEGRR